MLVYWVCDMCWIMLLKTTIRSHWAAQLGQKKVWFGFRNVGIAMPQTNLIFDGWNPTHKNGDDCGMVYCCYINIIPYTQYTLYIHTLYSLYT